MATSQYSDHGLGARWDQLWARLSGADLDALVITGAADLEYLTGYRTMPLERITALVVVAPQASDERITPLLLVPELERARVDDRPAIFELQGWDDSTDPMAIIGEHLKGSHRVAVSNDMWASHLLSLQQRLDGDFTILGAAFGGLRSIKAPAERDAMRAVGAMADKVADALQSGLIPLVGRSEAEVAADIGDRLIASGHEKVEFVIVASGPNSASPHHHPGERVIEAGEMVLCDFGGRYQGYCSDTTRCVFTGPIPADVAQAYEVLVAAQAAAVEAAKPGVDLAQVDRAARSLIELGGYGDYFVHRTGHGIGTQVHEEPYVTSEATTVIQSGHVFSVEPGIYIPGRWGMRLEDIVVVEKDGPSRCNNSNHELVSVPS